MNAATFPTRGCGPHTTTLVPDVANGVLYVYNSASSGLCPGIDIAKILPDNSAGATFLHRAATGRSCRDTGVILGTAMLAGCAGGNGFTVFSPGRGGGGTIENSMVLHSVAIPGVTVGHSAGFTWDSKVLSWDMSRAAAGRRAARRRAA
jgi:hypothetical protein